MYRTCTTARAAAQHQTFQQCLLEIMQIRPYQEITVTGLCETAGLSRKSFYRLFENKDDVLCAMIDQILRKFDTEQVPVFTAGQALYHLFSYWRKQEVFLDIIARNHQVSLLTERCLYHFTHENTSAKFWLGAIGHPFSEEILVYFLSGIMGLLIHWHHSGYVRTTEEMAQIALELLTRSPLNLPKEMR